MKLYILFIILFFNLPLLSKNTVTIKNFSTEGKSSKLHTFKSKKTQQHRFYIQSGLHGNEHGPIQLSNWLMKRLLDGKGKLSKLNETATLDFLPIANPDGHAKSDRYNKRGANLNRNFNILFGKTRENPGAYSFSEKETQAIKTILTSHKYTGAVDLHGYVNWIVGPSNPYILGNIDAYSNHKLEMYRNWDKALKKSTRNLKGYEYRTAGGLGDGGSFEDWAFWQLSIPAFCLEIEKLDKKTNVNKVFEKYEEALYQTFLSAIRVQEKSQSLNINLAHK